MTEKPTSVPSSEMSPEALQAENALLRAEISRLEGALRIVAGDPALERQPLDLRACVEASLERFAGAAAEKGLNLAYLMAPAVPECLVGDRVRLHQVMASIVSNAVTFTREGEVVVTLHATDSNNGCHTVHVTVQDTGIGIPADRHRTIFRAPGRADASTARTTGGLGLGLTVSARLAERMGGRLWVESKEGEGAAFHFTFEAPEALESEVRSGAERAYLSDLATELDERRLLVIEPNPINRRVLSEWAHRWGLRARFTASCEEGLSWLQEGDPFDVALIGATTAEVDGLALAREIRVLRSSQELPLVMVVHLGQEQRDDLKALASALVTLPIKPSVLYRTLLGALREEPAVGAAPPSGYNPSDVTKTLVDLPPR